MRNFVHNHALIALVAAGMSLFSYQTAQASSAFSSYATITYTIDSIANLSNPNSLSGLGISGSFEAVGSPDSYIIASGDGAVTAYNPNVDPNNIPLTVGSTFVQTFTASGTVSDGSVDTSQVGWFTLSLENTGTDNYTIGIKLDYQLHAEASGTDADSKLYLDYYTTDNPSLGSDFINASVFALANVTQTDTSGVVSFNLGSGITQAFNADVKITGNLQATTVPLPAAFWLFFSGISGLFAFDKRRKG